MPSTIQLEMCKEIHFFLQFDHKQLPIFSIRYYIQSVTSLERNFELVNSMRKCVSEWEFTFCYRFFKYLFIFFFFYFFAGLLSLFAIVVMYRIRVRCVAFQSSNGTIDAKRYACKIHNLLDVLSRWVTCCIIPLPRNIQCITLCVRCALDILHAEFYLM